MEVEWGLSKWMWRPFDAVPDLTKLFLDMDSNLSVIRVLFPGDRVESDGIRIVKFPRFSASEVGQPAPEAESSTGRYQSAAGHQTRPGHLFDTPALIDE